MRLYTLPYPGAKGRMANDLMAQMPQEGRIYCEPCAGLGTVGFRLLDLYPHRFKYCWFNDIRQGRFLQCIRTHAHTISVPPAHRVLQEYNRFKNQRKAGLAATPRSVLLEPYLSPRGGYGKGGATSRPMHPERYRQQLLQRQHLLRQSKARITSRDWQDLHLEQLTPEDFVFFDPPYFQADVRAYCSWPKEEYLKLIKLLTKARFRWMLTEYRQDFYVRALGEPFFTKKVTSLVSNNGSPRTECVWKGNF